ncbi:MAG: BatD family protein [Phycisphaerae bacterium]|nr:BatD family protein [Phycisphaerae bacterium]
MIRTILRAGLILIAIHGAARAAEIVAELSSSTAMPGEVVTLTITVRNAEDVGRPRIPRVSGLTIRLLNTEPTLHQQTLIINGRVSRQVDYTWTCAISAPRSGNYTIPPIRVTADGETLRTESIDLVITKSESGEPLIVEVDVDRAEAFVEEPVKATLRVWIRPFRQSDVVLTPEQMWSRALINEQETRFGTFQQPQFVGQRVRRSPDGGAANYYVYESQGTIWPEEAGALSLGEIRIVMQYPVSISRDFFGNLGLQRARTLSASPPTPPITIRPIPTEGRPPGFNGAVGRYTISASATPTNVRVGDPITLTLTIRGIGRLDRVPAPALSELEELTRDFKVPNESLAGQTDGYAKVFTQTIRATHANTREIPPIPFVFFNPKSARFETSRSAAIPITVREASQLSLSQVVEAEADRPRAARALVERTEGLVANYVDMNDVLTPQDLSMPTSWIVMLAACPIAYVGAWFLQRRSIRYREDVRYRRRAQAARTAHHRLHAARSASRNDAAAKVGHALTGYVADQLNAPDGALTRDEVRRLLNEKVVDAALRDELDAMLADIEQAAYGGMAGDEMRGLIERAEAVLRRLERVRW